MKRDDEFGQIKIRQPLAELTYGGVELSEFYETIIAEEVNVKKVSSGFMTNEKHGAVYVVLDKALTPELQREGYAREVVRHVQAARKAAGFNVDDRITLDLKTTSNELEQAINEYGETIREETLAQFDKKAGEHVSVARINGFELTIGVAKISH